MTGAKRHATVGLIPYHLWRNILEIQWQDLEEETLLRLLSELVTRDGTDYGVVERSTEAKVAAALRQLQKGSAVLYWDEESESASLLTRDQLKEQQAEYRKAAKDSGVQEKEN